MKKFFSRLGIQFKSDYAQNNKFLNILLIVIAIIYFGISVYNLVGVKNVSIAMIWLNCLAFVKLIITNYIKERDKIDKSSGDDRFSLYFFMFLVEMIIGLCLAVSLFFLGFDIDRWKTALIIMVFITLLNQLVEIIINLYKGE